MGVESSSCGEDCAEGATTHGRAGCDWDTREVNPGGYFVEQFRQFCMHVTVKSKVAIFYERSQWGACQTASLTKIIVEIQFALSCFINKFASFRLNQCCECGKVS